MRIAMFTDSLHPPNVDGVALLTSSWANKFAMDGHDVLVMTFHEKDFDEKKYQEQEFKTIRIHGYQVKSNPAYKVKLRLPPESVFKKIKEFKPDVIHSHSPACLGRVAQVYSRRLGVPHVTTFHTFLLEFLYLHVINPPEDAVPALKMLGKKPLNELIKWLLFDIGYRAISAYYSAVDHVTVPSRIIIDYLVENGVSRDNITYIPNPIELPSDSDFWDDEPALSPQEKDELRRKFGLGKNDFVILHVGRLSPEKRIEVALRTIRTLKDRGTIKNLKMIVTSTGPSKNHLKNIAKKLKINDTVIFTGYVPDEDLATLYKISDVFFTPSVFETFNISAARSMRYGLPIVGPKAAAIKDIVKNGINGYTVKRPRNLNAEVNKYADIIEKLYRDKDHFEKNKKEMIEMSKEYTLERTARDLMNVYQTVKFRDTLKDRMKYNIYDAGFKFIISILEGFRL